MVSAMTLPRGRFRRLSPAASSRPRCRADPRPRCTACLWLVGVCSRTEAEVIPGYTSYEIGESEKAWGILYATTHRGHKLALKVQTCAANECGRPPVLEREYLRHGGQSPRVVEIYDLRRGTPVSEYLAMDTVPRGI